METLSEQTDIIAGGAGEVARVFPYDALADAYIKAASMALEIPNLGDWMTSTPVDVPNTPLPAAVPTPAA